MSVPTRLTLPLIMAAIFMVVLDFFIVNVALPSMRSDLGASTGAIEWVVAGYGLTLAAVLVTGGRLGDQHGRRQIFALGMALFTASSLACGLAPSATALVVARLAQGGAAALLSPQVLAIIGASYAGPQRARALGVYGVTLGLAAVGGQLIGGALVSADVLGLGWRGCFLINVPIGAVTLALTRRGLPESRVRGAPRPDLPGTLLLTAALTAILLPLVEGRQHQWPTWTWLLLAAAPVAFGALFLQQRRLQRRGGAPLIEPSLLASRTFTAGLASQLALWCGQASFFLILALYLQQGRGLSAIDSGLVFSILAAAYVAASICAPGLTERLGRRLVAIGGACLAGGHGLLLAGLPSAGIDGSLGWLVPGLLLVGTGMGLCIPALMSVVLAGVGPDQAGSASAVLNTMQQVGNALGVAVTGVVFFGAVDAGYQHAFEIGVAQLSAVGLLVALSALLLPRRAGSPASGLADRVSPKVTTASA